MNAHAPLQRKLGLTPMQARMLEYITARIAAGAPPSFQEIADHFGFKSKSQVHHLVSRLVDRGHLLPVNRRERALALAPDAADAARLSAETLREIARAELGRRETAPGSGKAEYRVALPFDAALRLLDLCHASNRMPGEVIVTAIEDYLGRRP